MKVIMVLLLLFYCSRISLRAREKSISDFPIFSLEPTFEAKIYPDYEYFKVYPNPAEELVTIEIGMKLPARIAIMMLNSDGEIIRTLANDLFPAGRHFFETTLNSVPAGTYMIRYEKGDKVLTRKVVIK